MSEQYVFVDRYSATGTPYPDSETMCKGQCEGMGCVPISLPKSTDSCYENEPLTNDPEWRQLWEDAHAKNCNPLGIIRELWRNKRWWYWKSMGRDIWRWVLGKGYCNGWHFVKCIECNGTGKNENAST